VFQLKKKKKIQKGKRKKEKAEKELPKPRRRRLQQRVEPPKAEEGIRAPTTTDDTHPSSRSGHPARARPRPREPPPPPRTTMGSNEADKPLRRIGASFEELAAVAKQQQQPVAMSAGDFSRACSHVSVLFGCLGIAFKFAEMDYVAKASRRCSPSPSPPRSLLYLSFRLLARRDSSPDRALRCSELVRFLRCASLWYSRNFGCLEPRGWGRNDLEFSTESSSQHDCAC
jgi:hypothetical protein